MTTKNPNLHQNIKYGDIEGVWTYVYQSYSSRVKKVVAMLKYAGQNIERVEMNAVHPVPKFLRYILGGVDLKIYPGFNG
jgi:hypothetical protein